MKCQGVWLLLSAVFVALPRPARSDNGQLSAGIVMHAAALSTNEGSVYCALYANEKGFPTEPKYALTQIKVQPQNKKATCVFRDVKAGRYAVALWHDVNNNGKVDSNWLGIPKEPVGASNNVKGSFGPPKFASAAFEYRPPLLRQTIRLE
jgi:uncharacterized protein (DUF2141 family)